METGNDRQAGRVGVSTPTRDRSQGMSEPRYSLRWLLRQRLGWMLLVFVLVNILATGWWVVRPVMLASARHAFASTGERVIGEVRSLLSPVALQLKIAAQAFQAETVDPVDAETFRRLFQPVLAVMQQVTSAVAGDARGRGVMLLQMSGDRWLLRQTDRGAWGDEHRFRVWRHGRPVQDRRRRFDYDPRQRPWYRLGLEAPPGEVHWTHPYRFFTTGDAGITAFMRLSGRFDETVVGLDVKLSDLSRLVAAIRPSRRGAVMLLDDRGRVVGLPAALPNGPEMDADQVLQPLEKLPDARWARHFQNRLCDGYPRFAAAGSPWSWLAACNVFDLGGRRFTLLNLAPAADFFPPARSILVNALILVLGMLLMVVVGSWWVARKVSRPMEALQRAAERLLRLDWERPVQLRSRIREVHRVGRVLERFRRLLLGYRKRIEAREVQLYQRIQELENAERHIERLAFYDALTGLPNRALCMDRLEQAIALAAREQFGVAVFFIDLDHFKNINDSLGHQAGDHLLEEIARRLQRTLRREDTVARLGGDEFVVILSDVSEESVNRVAEKVLTAVRQPCQVLGHRLHVSCSIGVAFYPTDGDTAELLLRNADGAMYRAKKEGRDRVRYYTADINRRAVARLALEEALHQALERGEFLLHYQPRIDAESGHILGVEALVRWQHPQRGLVPPGEFIPLAEQTGLIQPLGQWVLEEACRQAMTWQSAGFEPLAVAVNISQRQFMDRSLASHVQRLLDRTGLWPALLELEITETMIATRVDEGVAMLEELAALGVRLAIDDFGTGYSSLSQLKRFPVHVLKIDKSFVEGVPDEPGDLAIVRAILSLARVLGLDVVAEGVETEEQFHFLRLEGCREMQGYYLAKPMPAAELEKRLREGGTWVPQ